ncbi:MAG: YiiX/YebB-like N1pC/P60 family cysteine hydrolase [bacterium]|nr:YiiX/YebB-like N1pC/P60 family cysteine hydrolase [bacterium]
MLRLFIFLFLFMASCSATRSFQAGDLIFQDLNCGDLCTAIEDVTQRQFNVSGPNLSHVGILSKEDQKWFVYEAYDAVQRTPLKAFLKRSRNQFRLARFKTLTPKQREDLAAFAKKELGTPYDEDFQINNKKYYCSELVLEAFMKVSDNQSLSYLSMYYGDLTDPEDRSAQIWKEYFTEKGQPVPSGQPGISPLAIYLSKAVEVIQ